MKTLALVLATLYLHQFISGWAECFVGFCYGFIYARGWKITALAASEVGLGWLITAFVFDELSDGRVNKIGASLFVNSDEGTYALTFFVAFIAFGCWALFGYFLQQRTQLFKSFL